MPWREICRGEGAVNISVDEAWGNQINLRQDKEGLCEWMKAPLVWWCIKHLPRGSIPRWVGNKDKIIGNFLPYFTLQLYTSIWCTDDDDDLIFDDILPPRFVHEICFRFFPSLSILTEEEAENLQESTWTSSEISELHNSSNCWVNCILHSFRFRDENMAEYEYKMQKHKQNEFKPIKGPMHIHNW